MKVYSDIKGPYILLRNKAIQEAGFKEGQSFTCAIIPEGKRIILEAE